MTTTFSFSFLDNQVAFSFFLQLIKPLFLSLPVAVALYSCFHHFKGSGFLLHCLNHEDSLWITYTNPDEVIALVLGRSWVVIVLVLGRWLVLLACLSFSHVLGLAEHCSSILDC